MLLQKNINVSKLHFKLKKNCVIGKSPLYEVRQWDDFANDSVKYVTMLEKDNEERPYSTDDDNVDSEVKSGEKDIDHTPTLSKKWSSTRFGIKRSSPMQVYTYKVNYSSVCTLCLIK